MEDNKFGFRTLFHNDSVRDCMPWAIIGIMFIFWLTPLIFAVPLIMYFAVPKNKQSVSFMINIRESFNYALTALLADIVYVMILWALIMCLVMFIIAKSIIGIYFVGCLIFLISLAWFIYVAGLYFYGLAHSLQGKPYQIPFTLRIWHKVAPRCFE